MSPPAPPAPAVPVLPLPPDPLVKPEPTLAGQPARTHTETRSEEARMSAIFGARRREVKRSREDGVDSAHARDEVIVDVTVVEPPPRIIGDHVCHHHPHREERDDVG